MAQEGPSADRLDSWKAIATYVGRDVRTVVRWEQRGGLPVYRVPVGQRQAVYAFKHEIDEWMSGVTPGSFQLAAALEVAAASPGWNHETDSAVATLPEFASGSKSRDIRRWLPDHRWLVTVLALLALLAMLGFLGYSSLAPRRFVLSEETQITNDGTHKDWLITDGHWLYFSEKFQGRARLARVSTAGGPVEQIPTPFPRAEPVSVSPDGQKLLLLVREGEEMEWALWILPVAGGAPERAGSVLCHDATWAPDGRRIIFAFGNAIYLTADYGATNHQLQAFSGIPFGMRWSMDGHRILFRLRESTWSHVLWELTLAEGESPHVLSLTPLGLAAGDIGTISVTLNRYDDALMIAGESVFAVTRRRLPWQSGFALTKLDRLKGNVLAADPVAHRLYISRGAEATHELYWFDHQSHQFHPFLAGVSAYDVDFSPDGRHLVYVPNRNDQLWTSWVDGSSARQIPTPGIKVLELPRWSPDGKHIAFMGRLSDAPYRIYITTPEGGPLLEASHGTDNQGAPTWSPDGQHLVYGRVLCQEERTCAIQEIDLSKRTQTMVPGSEGLSTARWSPDGRYIAALRVDKHEVWLLDRTSARWRKIADGVDGNDLAWSPDSRAIYASRPNGGKPEVLRISLPTMEATDAVDLSAFNKLPGLVETWFAVTPDDSILFVRVSGGQEIFGFHYSER